MTKKIEDFITDPFLKELKNPNGEPIAFIMEDHLKYFNYNRKSKDYGSHTPIAFRLQKRMAQTNHEKMPTSLPDILALNRYGSPIERKTLSKTSVYEEFCTMYLQHGVTIEQIYKELDRVTPEFFSKSKNKNDIMFNKLITKHDKTGIEFTWEEKSVSKLDAHCLILTKMNNAFDYFNGMSLDKIRLEIIDLISPIFMRECGLISVTKTTESHQIACNYTGENPYTKKKKRGPKKS